MRKPKLPKFSVIAVLSILVMILLMPVAVLAQPQAPHAFDAPRADCLSCHTAGGGAVAAPHVGYTNATCKGCHQSASTTAPATPAPVVTTVPAPAAEVPSGTPKVGIPMTGRAPLTAGEEVFLSLALLVLGIAILTIATLFFVDRRK